MHADAPCARCGAAVTEDTSGTITGTFGPRALPIQVSTPLCDECYRFAWACIRTPPGHEHA